MNFSFEKKEIDLFGGGLAWPSEDLLSEIAELDYCFFSRPWTLASWQSLEKNSDEYLLAIIRGPQGVLGHALWKFSILDSLAHLLKFYVQAEFRREGLGKKLFNHCKNWFEEHGVIKIYLEVEEENESAIFFYRRIGLETIHHQKGHYSDGKGAFIMGQNL